MTMAVPTMASGPSSVLGVLSLDVDPKRRASQHHEADAHDDTGRRRLANHVEADRFDQEDVQPDDEEQLA